MMQSSRIRTIDVVVQSDSWGTVAGLNLECNRVVCAWDQARNGSAVGGRGTGALQGLYPSGYKHRPRYERGDLTDGDQGVVGVARRRSLTSSGVDGY